MGDEPPEVARRRGRPPATDSATTWHTILHGARALFAERGYAAVTNKELAAAAGITTGALYHYVESKLDLYLAAHADVQDRVYERFNVAVDGADTFVGKFEAVLEAAHQMNEEDHTLALFVGAVRTDVRRFPEISARLATDNALRERFFTSLVDTGIATGEIDECDRHLVAEFIRIVLIGLTDGGSSDSRQHRRAIDGIEALIRGRLIHPVVA
jgi:AcrR family transcriptional regulator